MSNLSLYIKQQKVQQYLQIKIYFDPQFFVRSAEWKIVFFPLFWFSGTGSETWLAKVVNLLNALRL